MKRNDVDTALAAMDRALADRADLVYDDLSAAVCALVELRDALIAESRGGNRDAARCLTRLNPILSVVVAAEYPLEGVRRDRVADARADLASLFG